MHSLERFSLLFNSTSFLYFFFIINSIINFNNSYNWCKYKLSKIIAILWVNAYFNYFSQIASTQISNLIWFPFEHNLNICICFNHFLGDKIFRWIISLLNNWIEKSSCNISNPSINNQLNRSMVEMDNSNHHLNSLINSFNSNIFRKGVAITHFNDNLIVLNVLKWDFLSL